MFRFRIHFMLNGHRKQVEKIASCQEDAFWKVQLTFRRAHKAPTFIEADVLETYALGQPVDDSAYLSDVSSIRQRLISEREPDVTA